MNNKRDHKWKYLLYFQKEEFTELVAKEILEILRAPYFKIS